VPEAYRFWGRTDPRGRTKDPLLASVPASVGTSEDTTVVRIYEPIDSWGGEWGMSSAELAPVLDSISTPRIELHLNSPGGEAYEAIAVLNMLRTHPARITAVVDGLAASAASFVAAGADELIMSPNTELMIHDAWGIGIGDAALMREIAGRLDALSDNIASIYAGKAGGDVEQWRAAMITETWYSAEEAVTAGLADSVATIGGGEQNSVSDRWDLAQFRARGRRNAHAPVLASQREREAWARRHRHNAAAQNAPRTPAATVRIPVPAVRDLLGRDGTKDSGARGGRPSTHTTGRT
jgi:ATP-dependent protease ClpP protease subunit